MTGLVLFALALAAIVAIGSTLVAIYDPIERAVLRYREARIRADVRRGPWGPR
jgi:hypothetical protein